MARAYRVVMAKTRGGLANAATGDWTILENTVRQYSELNSNDDQSLLAPGNRLRLLVLETGWVALAYREVS